MLVRCEQHLDRLQFEYDQLVEFIVVVVIMIVIVIVVLFQRYHLVLFSVFLL